MLRWKLCKRGHEQKPRNVKWTIYKYQERGQCRLCANLMRKAREARRPPPRYILKTDWSMDRGDKHFGG